jgi:uncharacterized protein YecE (DUF72 family)
MQRKVVLVGTSGWAYWGWRGRFYPEDLPQRDWLRHYCARYATVELNCTFYRLPTERAVRGWAATAPPGFLFAAKGSRYITHRLLLRAAGEALAQFLGRLGLLGERLGPILWQLPPGFERNEEVLAAFLELLPQGKQYAFEFRHPSWYEGKALEQLEERGCALCLHDWGRRAWPKLTTARWTYVRLHSGSGRGGAYSQEELAAWADWLAQALEEGLERAYVYFNNDAMANAIADSQTLIAMLQERCRGVAFGPGAERLAQP